MSAPRPPARAATVQLKLALPLARLGSFAVTVTAYGLPDDAVPEIVPLITPVDGSIPSPGGNPLALYVSTSPSTSDATIGRVIASFSTLPWLPGLVTVGAWLLGAAWITVSTMSLPVVPPV